MQTSSRLMIVWMVMSSAGCATLVGNQQEMARLSSSSPQSVSTMVQAPAAGTRAPKLARSTATSETSQPPAVVQQSTLPAKTAAPQPQDPGTDVAASKQLPAVDQSLDQPAVSIAKASQQASLIDVDLPAVTSMLPQVTQAAPRSKKSTTPEPTSIEEEFVVAHSARSHHPLMISVMVVIVLGGITCWPLTRHPRYSQLLTGIHLLRTNDVEIDSQTTLLPGAEHSRSAMVGAATSFTENLVSQTASDTLAHPNVIVVSHIDWDLLPMVGHQVHSIDYEAEMQPQILLDGERCTSVLPIKPATPSTELACIRQMPWQPVCNSPAWKNSSQRCIAASMCAFADAMRLRAEAPRLALPAPPVVTARAVEPTSTPLNNVKPPLSPDPIVVVERQAESICEVRALALLRLPAPRKKLVNLPMLRPAVRTVQAGAGHGPRWRSLPLRTIEAFTTRQSASQLRIGWSTRPVSRRPVGFVVLFPQGDGDAALPTQRVLNIESLQWVDDALLQAKIAVVS